MGTSLRLNTPTLTAATAKKAATPVAAGVLKRTGTATPAATTFGGVSRAGAGLAAPVEVSPDLGATVKPSTTKASAVVSGTFTTAGNATATLGSFIGAEELPAEQVHAPDMLAAGQTAPGSLAAADARGEAAGNATQNTQTDALFGTTEEERAEEFEATREAQAQAAADAEAKAAADAAAAREKEAADKRAAAEKEAAEKEARGGMTADQRVEKFIADGRALADRLAALNKEAAELVARLNSYAKVPTPGDAWDAAKAYAGAWFSGGAEAVLATYGQAVLDRKADLDRAGTIGPERDDAAAAFKLWQSDAAALDAGTYPDALFQADWTDYRKRHAAPASASSKSTSALPLALVLWYALGGF